MSERINIRKVALSVLDRIEAAGQYSNIALDTAITRSGTSGADRALLTSLVYGVIERKITLDYCINSMSSIPPSKIEGSVRNALRMGLYQLAYLDRIPDHAAVGESVELVGRRSKGFVNALLRGFARGDRKMPLPDEKKGEAAYLSVKYSVSEGICQRFLRDFGSERTEEILSSLCGGASMTLRVNTLKTTRDELIAALRESGSEAEKTELSPCGIRLCGGYSDIPLEREGYWFVQDEASQLCAEALGAMAGETVIDCCACPGGKSFSIAMNMENKGRLLSFDLHKNKLSLIEKNAERLGISIIETAEKDGRIFDPALFEVADRMLLDVPCSGLGVMAKKPDIRYKDIADAERLPQIQLAIADNCVAYLKKGGTMVYSTCTILKSENEDVVEKLISAHSELELVPFLGAESGMITLYPGKTDGFFIAKLRKKH